MLSQQKEDSACCEVHRRHLLFEPPYCCVPYCFSLVFLTWGRLPFQQRGILGQRFKISYEFSVACAYARTRIPLACAIGVTEVMEATFFVCAVHGCEWPRRTPVLFGIPSACPILPAIISVLRTIKGRTPFPSKIEGRLFQPPYIHPVHRVVDAVPVPVPVAALCAQWVQGGEAARVRVIVPPDKARQARIRIKQPARKAKREPHRPLKPPKGVAESIVPHRLY
ncbi:hypothetical protein SAMN04488503_2688, partial [Humidesulfovibrio mexicanus]